MWREGIYYQSANASLGGSEEHRPSAKMFNQETSNHAVVHVLLASPRGKCERQQIVLLGHALCVMSRYPDIERDRPHRNNKWFKFDWKDTLRSIADDLSEQLIFCNLTLPSNRTVLWLM